MVSTDSDEIRRIAEACGAKVPFMRSPATSGDMAATHEVVTEVLQEYKKTGREFEYVCCIYPTAPFITAEKLLKSKELLEKTQADSVIPVVAFSFPPQRCFVIREGRISWKQPENRFVRSQDLETLYHDCGQFYFYHTKRYMACRGDLPDGYVPIIVPETEVQDIDNLTDWKLAEMKYRMMAEEAGRQQYGSCKERGNV